MDRTAAGKHAYLCAFTIFVSAFLLFQVQPIIAKMILPWFRSVLPILPNRSWKPTDANNPSFLILGLLSVTIGLPYMILSTTSPRLQSWYARRAGSVPYRLFALSNLAARAPVAVSHVQIDRGVAPTPDMRALWIALSACASTLLLAVTTFLTQDVAALPFLWVLPLSVYLLSFIICFESAPL